MKKFIILGLIVIGLIVIYFSVKTFTVSRVGEYNASGIGQGEAVIAMCPWYSGAVTGNCISQDPINFPIGAQLLFKVKANQSYNNGWLCNMSSNNKAGTYSYEVQVKCRVGIRPILGIIF